MEVWWKYYGSVVDVSWMYQMGKGGLQWGFGFLLLPVDRVNFVFSVRVWVTNQTINRLLNLNHEGLIRMKQK